MTQPLPTDELFGLMYDLAEDRLTAEKAARLEGLLLADPANRQRYVDFMLLVGGLHRTRGDVPARPESRHPKSEVPNRLSSIPPIVVNPSPVAGGSPSAGLFVPGGYLFSYIVGAVLLGIGLLIGWAWRTSQNERLLAGAPAQTSPNCAAEQPPPVVGRITGAVDCRWTDPKSEVFFGDYVRPGREYNLASGYLEITYQSGAKVILQGPVKYVVESNAGGFLSLGKLTARVERRASNVESRSQHLTLDSRLFSVRTPTAIVTDFGTEFGVEVDKSGATKSHVFQGKVELRLTDSREPTAPGGSANPLRIFLGPNESAVVDAGQRRVAKLISEADRSPAPAFVRQMPRRVPIQLFNTGVGLRAGDPDPHWQLVARSDDPNFQPRAAVVSSVRRQASSFRQNDPAWSQWISTQGDMERLPNGVTYTFRTTFELAGVLPGSAVVRGGFLADNHVTAIRLNGVAAPVPQHDYTPPYGQHRWFEVAKGFVRGTNVLEFDVFNGVPDRLTSGDSFMALLVTLEGTALSEGPPASNNQRKSE
jgi:hypothetical protein